MAIYQCCYTNASATSSGITKSGWQTVAVSKGIPIKAYEKCAGFQTVNSVMQGAMLDENRDTLNLLEFCGDEEYIYVMRTQYGLLDSSGRSNMFSHAFVMPWADGVINDPNGFLCISDSCFKDNIEEAEYSYDNLLWDDPWTLESALGFAGIEAESYLTLIRCVVARLIEKSYSQPLYVQYDGTARQLRAITYCIYAGLPHYLRKRLSIASSPTTNTNTKKLVFSIRAKEQRQYVNPLSGDNSVLTDRFVRKIGRLGYLDYIPKSLADCDPEDYFKKLDAKAVELGDRTASNPYILRIAHHAVTNYDYFSLDDESLKEEISDVLMSTSEPSQEMERLLALLVNLACDRGLALSELTDSELSKRLVHATTDEYKDACDRYLISRFSEMPEDDAIKRLKDMDPSLLDKYIKWLQETPRGLNILDGYYASLVYSAERINWTLLFDVADRSAYLQSRKKTIDALDAKASGLYAWSLDRDIRKGQQNYTKYIELMKKILPPEGVRLCMREAKEAYWTRVTIETFSVDQRKVYERMKIDGEKPKAAVALADIIGLLEIPDEERYLREARGFLLTYPEVLGDTDSVVQFLVGEVRETYSGEDRNLNWWFQVIRSETSDDAAQIMLLIRRSLLNDNPSAFFRNIESLIELRGIHRVGTDNDVKVIKAAISQVERWDARVPFVLDDWLLLGDALGQNPFAIFDYAKPTILQMKPADVVAESVLVVGILSNNAIEASNARRYSAKADEYVRNNGTESKVVKKWIKEARKMTGSGKGFLDKIGSVFSKRPGKKEKTYHNGAADNGYDCPPGGNWGMRHEGGLSPDQYGQQTDFFDGDYH